MPRPFRVPPLPLGDRFAADACDVRIRRGFGLWRTSYAKECTGHSQRVSMGLPEAGNGLGDLPCWAAFAGARPAWRASRRGIRKADGGTVASVSPRPEHRHGRQTRGPAQHWTRARQLTTSASACAKLVSGSVLRLGAKP